MATLELERMTAGPRIHVERRSVPEPFFSICIPQYDRTSFLLASLRSLVQQTVRNFEVCISDDLSPDGRQGEIVEFLESGDLAFCFSQRDRNGRYDANLRSAIALARGRYCFLLGNDDALAEPAELASLEGQLRQAGFPAVCVSNFADFQTGKPHRRVFGTGSRGRGPQAAVAQFRNFSFVSGVVLDRRLAQAASTERWDGSEMYQTFVACRMLAQGNECFGVDRIVVRKDIFVAGENVDSYSRWERLDPCPIVERRLPLCQLGRVVADAIAPYGDQRALARWNARVVAQLLCFTLPFWIFEYRRVQSWKYAAGVCLGMRVGNLADGLPLGALRRALLHGLHGAVCLAGLVLPVRIFDWLKRPLYFIAKARR